MTNEEVQLILNDIQKVREILTLEQAAKVPNLFPKLKANQEIKKGQRFNIADEVYEAKEDIINEFEKNPINCKVKWSKHVKDGN